MNTKKTYMCRIKVKKTYVKGMHAKRTEIWATNSDGQENLYLNSKIDMYREWNNFNTVLSIYWPFFKMAVPRILPNPPLVSQHCPEWDLLWFSGLIPGAIFVCVFIGKSVFLKKILIIAASCAYWTLTRPLTNLFSL